MEEPPPSWLRHRKERGLETKERKKGPWKGEDSFSMKGKIRQNKLTHFAKSSHELPSTHKSDLSKVYREITNIQIDC